MPETKVIQVQLSDDEFHFVLSAMGAIASQTAGELGLAIDYNVNAVRWMREIGDEGMSELFARFNRLHATICNLEDPHE